MAPWAVKPLNIARSLFRSGLDAKNEFPPLKNLLNKSSLPVVGKRATST
jgi:hypothetical protein